MNRKVIWLITAAAFAAPAVAQAQAAQTQGQTSQDQATPTDAPTNQAGPGDVEDIIVLAQRRSERAQNVPISLTVLEEKQLERANVNDVLDLVKVTPSFSARRQAQTSNTTLFIRGIGSGGNSAVEPSVGAYVDGIYIARPGPLLASLNDVASVEVLRGPQGTLFGRNASVGAVSFNTAEPENDFSGQVSAFTGSYGALNLNGRINLPVTEDVSLRFSALYDHTDGFGLNALTNEDFGRNSTVSLRGSAKFNLSHNLEWLLRADYQKVTGDGSQPTTVVRESMTPTTTANLTRILAGRIPDLVNTYSREVRQITDGSLRDKQYGGVSDLRLDLGNDYSVRLLSGLRKWTNDQVDRSTPLVPADLFGRQSEYVSKSHSEELQFLTPAAKPLSAVAGLYYFRERYTIGVPVSLGPDYCNIFVRNARPALLPGCLAGPQALASDSDFNQLTKSYAAFGQATYRITPAWEVTAGIRWTREEKSGSLVSINYNPAAALLAANDNVLLAFDGDKVTYRLNTTYKILPDVMAYATYATGYKSGGFDATTGATLSAARRTYRPERVENVEFGVKSQWLDRRLTANATYFVMTVSDFQLRSYDGLAFSVRNAGSVRQKGLEFELSARPVDGLSFGVAGTRLDSTYVDFKNAPNLPGLAGTQDLSGRWTGTAKWSGTANASYEGTVTKDWSFIAGTNVQFTSDTNVGTGGDLNPQGFEDAYALVGARLTFLNAGAGFEFALSADNIGDHRYCASKNAQILGGPLGVTANGVGMLRCVLGEPRTFRASAKIAF